MRTQGTAGSAGEWHWIWEDNGWDLSYADRTASLAQDREAVTVFWNVNANTSFNYAKDGVLVREFDPLLSEPGTAASNLSLAQAGDYDWVDANAARNSLALLADLTGVVIDGPRWLTRQADVTFGYTPSERPEPEAWQPPPDRL